MDLHTYRKYSQFKSLPKVELHCHLEGSLRLHTIIGLYKQNNIPFPTKDDKEYIKYFQTTKPVGSLENFLKAFEYPAACIKTLNDIERITYELVIDKASDNVKLLEIRFAPTYLQQHCKTTYDNILKSIMKGIEIAQKVEEIEVVLVAIGVPSFGMNALREVVKFAIKNKDVVRGFDIAGVEMHADDAFLQQGSALLDQIRTAGIGITVHAAECLQTGKPENAVHAVNRLHATRIGHGIQIVKSKKVMEFIKTKGIVLEICPTSNIITSAIKTYEEHPIKELMDYGIKVTVNTDDPGIMNVKLTDEYLKLHQCFNYDNEFFENANKVAFEASFANYESKRKMKDYFF